jgi:hypothetical protein
MDVKLGRINPQQVPGILGQKLQVDAMETQLRWAKLKMDQMEMVKRAEEERAELQKQQDALKQTATDTPTTESK